VFAGLHVPDRATPRTVKRRPPAVTFRFVSKRCRRCGQVKPLEEFPIARGNRDGRRTECNHCMREYTSKRYRATRATVPDPSPARALRTVLRDLRRDGLDFDLAWPAAVNRALSVTGDPSWRSTFSWSREALAARLRAASARAGRTAARRARTTSSPRPNPILHTWQERGSVVGSPPACMTSSGFLGKN
jgi:hypothetical protein